MFLCILRARQRTQNTQKHVQKDELRRSRNMYGRIVPWFVIPYTLVKGKVFHFLSRGSETLHSLFSKENIFLVHKNS